MIKDPQPFPIWASVSGFIVIVLLVYGCSYWVGNSVTNHHRENPSYQVTHRDYAVYVGQNPDHDLIEPVLDKLSPEQAEVYVHADREAAERYYAWVNFVKGYDAGRPIKGDEFSQFLQQQTVWTPQNWAEAPKGYAETIEALPGHANKDIGDQLPQDAKLAFLGWKNRKEKTEISAYKPTYGDLHDLLDKQPRYGPGYWSIALRKSNPNYLRTYARGDARGEYTKDQPIPEDEKTSMLQHALYNHMKAKKGQ